MGLLVINSIARAGLLARTMPNLASPLLEKKGHPAAFTCKKERKAGWEGCYSGDGHNKDKSYSMM